MITKDTIEKLVEKLGEARNHFLSGTTPDKAWLDEADWMVFSVGRDNLEGRFAIDGFVCENEVDDLEEQVSELEEENARLHDMVDDLEDEVE